MCSIVACSIESLRPLVVAPQLRMASNSFVTVFVIGKQEGPLELDISGVTSYGGLLRALGSIIDLSNQERSALVLRKVDGEPNKRNAQSKFASAGETAEIIDTATLPKVGGYVVGEIRRGLFWPIDPVLAVVVSRAALFVLFVVVNECAFAMRNMCTQCCMCTCIGHMRTNNVAYAC